MNIVDFLLARIAEDEKRARVHEAHIHADGSIHGVSNPDEPCPDCFSARGLAECEAKRRIVETHNQGGARWTGFPRADVLEHYCMHDQQASPCPTLCSLVAVYADHPDYDEAWRG